MKKTILIALLAIAGTAFTAHELRAQTGGLFGLWEMIFGDKDEPEADIKVVKGGKSIIISDFTTLGKITILDFYADWCGPCRALSPKLEKLAKANSDVALRKLDIVNWRSPLSKQMSKQYNLQSIPFVLIFDKKGELLGKVIGNDIATIKMLVAENS